MTSKQLKYPVLTIHGKWRSPFTDYVRKPRGGPHASRTDRLERIQRRELRHALREC